MTIMEKGSERAHHVWIYTSWIVLIIGLMLLIFSIYFYKYKYIFEMFTSNYGSNEISIFLIIPTYNLFLIIIIYVILLFCIITTWVLFKLFPAIPDAPNIVTVFVGIFGVITGSIGLYILLT